MNELFLLIIHFFNYHHSKQISHRREVPDSCSSENQLIPQILIIFRELSEEIESLSHLYKATLISPTELMNKEQCLVKIQFYGERISNKFALVFSCECTSLAG